MRYLTRGLKHLLN